ncbi:MAG: hypothetical protein R2874_10235 [Desulfobacterales bacterium]
MLSPVFVSSDIYGTRSSGWSFLWDHGENDVCRTNVCARENPSGHGKEKTYEIAKAPPAAGENCEPKNKSNNFVSELN